MKFMENTKINFMKFKSFGFGLSSVLAFGSIILLLMGLNLGIDFKGGTAIGVSFSEDVSIEEVRDSLKSVSLNDSLADLSRSGFMNGDISTVMSPRTVLTWAENYLIFNDIEYAFKLSFLNRCDEIERPIIEEYFQRSFGIDISDAKVANVKE